MPRISLFYGIAIYLYYTEHGVPHFHARYGGEKAAIDIDSGRVLKSSLSPRALRLVKKWHQLHRDELLTRWEDARKGLPLDPIDPLP